MAEGCPSYLVITGTIMDASTTERDQINLLKKSYRELNAEEIDLAVELNKQIIHADFDPKYTEYLNEEILTLLNLYFRPQFIGFEELPGRVSEDVPLIYACNHSGMAFPWDAIIFGAGLFKQHNYDLKNLFRALAAPMLSASNLMNPFLLTDLWKRVGAVDATGLNFETMMNQSETNILIYPEGVPGIGKGFNRRYQLQAFSTSMIRMAIKYKTDIIGVSCINGEYINPYSYSMDGPNRFVRKLGIPFFPIAVHTIALLIQPWTFYYAWPAKLTYVKGNRYRPYEMVNKPWEEVTVEDIKEIRDLIHADMQAEIDKNVMVYGEKPFDWKEFRANLRKHWRSLPYWTPIGWPALFTEYDRLYQKGGEQPKNISKGWFQFWRIIARNPIVLAYFIPVFGWIPLLYRGMRGRRKVAAWDGSGV